MIAALATWAGVGAVLALVVTGLGLALRRVVPGRPRAALLLPLGFSVLVVTGTIAAALDLPAAAPLALLLLAAAWGYLGLFRIGTGPLPDLRARPRTDLRWGVAALLTTWLIYTVVVAATGQTTFGGYLLIGDPVIHMVGADSLLGGGGPWADEPGAYNAFFQGYYGTGYPTGGASVLALADALVGLDPVRVLHPVLVLAMTVFASAVWVLITPVVQRAWLRAMLTVLATVPSLTFAFVLMSSLKEVVTIAVVASSAAACTMLWPDRAASTDGPEGTDAPAPAPASSDVLAPSTDGEHPTSSAGEPVRWEAARLALGVAIGPAAAIAAIGPAGVVYAGPIFAVVVVALVLTHGPRVAVTRALWAAGLAALLCIPSLVSLRSYLDVSGTVLTTQAELGNLRDGPLSWLQVLGVWIGPDYRIDPTYATATLVAGILVLVLALLGVGAAARAVRQGHRRALGLVAWFVASGLAAVVVIRVGSPWADAKALAITAPTVMAAAGVGVAALWSMRRVRWLGTALGLVVVAAVAASTLSTSYELGTAPQARFDELAAIDDRYEGQGPMVTAEFEEFVRHALRKVPASFGADSYLPQTFNGRYGFSGDQDDLGTVEVQRNRLMLVRMGPEASRPPSNFRRDWRGRYYEVWRRDDRLPVPREHRGVGDINGNGQAIAPCSWITEVASLAQAGDQLVAATRRPVATQIVAALPLPTGWRRDITDPRIVNPFGSGRFAFTLKAQAPNQLVDVWFEGSFSRRIAVTANGRRGAIGPSALNPRASSTRVMTARADADGAVRIELERPGRALRPAWGNGPETWGPVSITAVDPLGEARLQEVDPADARRRLCGRSIDWLEIVHGGSAAQAK